MPLYNFQRQFAPNVIMGLWLAFLDLPPLADREAETAEARRLGGLLDTFNVRVETEPKGQTIRPCRKRQTKPGETLYLYTGTRSKQCVKLGEAVCKSVQYFRLYRDVEAWPHYELGEFRYALTAKFAQADGFDGVEEMMAFFQKTHGLPFHGELITW